MPDSDPLQTYRPKRDVAAPGEPSMSQPESVLSGHTAATLTERRFSEWTTDGWLRHPRFIRLRNDKPAERVVREVART